MKEGEKETAATTEILTTNDVKRTSKMYQNQNALNVNWVLCDARSNQLRPF